MNSFIYDQEKMVDFFNMSKDEFLTFYGYLTEDEYEATKRDVLKRSGYWNDEIADNNPYLDGKVLLKICVPIIVMEWLNKRGE